MNYKDKEYIWIHPHPDFEWLPGKIVCRNDAKKIFEVEDEYGDMYEVKEKDAEFVHGDSLAGADDLINLGDFNEGALQHNVRVRFDRDDIYTSIGQAILIAVNPYKKVDLYNEAFRLAYMNKTTEEFELTRPHLYKMAEISYSSLKTTRTNQSMIISGESGAGKTESTKIILKYIAKYQLAVATGSGDESSIEDKILYTNPVLEAFGNAKTIRNDNSSRFGKFIELYFDDKNVIYSAKIDNYLLEKSRIVTQQENERNYHIFYQLCRSAPEELRESLELSTTKTYNYMNESYDTYEDFEERDVADFEEMLVCMKGLKFSEQEKTDIFEIVASILHLGEVKFIAERNDASSIRKDSVHYKICARLLGIDPANLELLCCNKIVHQPNGKPKIKVDVDADGAKVAKDTLAKIVYEKLFDWIIDRVNISINKPFEKPAKSYKMIGLLDIFGFEIFKENSFEQLNINYTNEKLQQHFNSHMFKIEQKEYNQEKINWSDIKFVDNAACIEMLEGKRNSIFSLLDQQCKFKSNSTTESDKKCLDLFYSHLTASPYFLAGDVKFKHKGFGVGHYAGNVYYHVASFTEKNINAVNKEINTILSESSNKLLNTIFKQELIKEEGNKKTIESVTASFTRQLGELMETLSLTAPLYVRCIKPNNVKQPENFESWEVCRQLRCAGMLEAIRIRKLGFPVRRLYDAFNIQYKNLFNQFGIKGTNKKERTRDFVEHLYKEKHLEKAKKEIQLGQTKVFMKEHVKQLLDQQLEKAIVVFAVRIQKNIRAFIYKKRYQKLRKLTIFLQRQVRRLALYKKIKKRAKERVIREREPALMITRAAKKYLFRKKFMGKQRELIIRKKMELDQIQDTKEIESPGRPSEMEKIKGILSQLMDQRKGCKESGFEGMGKSDVSVNSDEEEHSQDWQAELEALRDENIALRGKVENLENDKLNTDNEMVRLNDRTQRYKEELKRKDDKCRMLERLGKEFQVKDKLFKEERTKLRNVILEKDKKQKKMSEEGNLDSDFQTKLEDEVDKMRSKDKEVMVLKKKKRELEYRVAHMSKKLMEIGNKDKDIEKLIKEVEYYKAVSLPSSQSNSLMKNPNGEVAYYKKKLDEYKQTNDLCADLVRDLVGMIQWKYIEVEFVKKSFENRVTEEEKVKFETQKSKEKRIFERMLNNYKQLEEIKKREREEEEENSNQLEDGDYESGDMYSQGDEEYTGETGDDQSGNNGEIKKPQRKKHASMLSTETRESGTTGTRKSTRGHH